MPDPSHKFQTKDLGKTIIDKASAGRVKFAKPDNISVDAVVRPGGLLKKLKLDQWNDFEKPLKKEFDDAVDDLEKSVAKFVTKADDELKNAAPDMYDLFLKPINIQLEHKFQEQCQRIHAALERKLGALLSNTKDDSGKKVKADAGEAKIDIGFEFEILQSSSKRVISSSSSTAPIVKAGVATKELMPAVYSCDTARDKVEDIEKELRLAILNAARVPADKKEAELKKGRQSHAQYRNALTTLDNKLRDLVEAITGTQDGQEHWKKRLSAAKPDQHNETEMKRYGDMKKTVDSVVDILVALSKTCKKTRDEALKQGAEQAEALEKGLNALSNITVADPRLAAAVAPARGPASEFLKDVADLLTEAKKKSAEVQVKVKHLEDLSKAAAAAKTA